MLGWCAGAMSEETSYSRQLKTLFEFVYLVDGGRIHGGLDGYWVQGTAAAAAAVVHITPQAHAKHSAALQCAYVLRSAQQVHVALVTG